MTHSEPAVRHTVLAISSLFESYGLSSNAEPTVNRFAIQHYNRAINILVNATAPRIDLVLPVCVLFICIEFLRGNSEAAVIHASHGVELYNATEDNSRLSSILSQMSIFPLFFVQGGAEFPLLRREVDSAAEEPPEFFNISKAQSIFGHLCVESLRITRAVNSYQFNTDQSPSKEIIALQQEVEQDIKAWGDALGKFQAARPDTDREDSTGLALMLWYKLIKLWLSECLETSETEDKDLGDEVINWVRITAENLKTHQIKPAEFIYSTGFKLMLHFTINRCRYRPLRLEALSLMRKLSSDNGGKWEERVRVENDSDLVGENDLEDETLPPDRERCWKSVVLRKESRRKSKSLSGEYSSPVSLLTFKMHSNIRALIVYLLSGASLATAQPAPTQTHQITLAAREPTTTAAPVGWFTTTKNIATIGGTTEEYFTLPATTIQIVIPTCIQTHEPDENGFLPPGTCNANWNYYPSFSAAAALAVLFAVLTAVHVWQAARYKKSWCWVIIMAGIWETVAFTFRAISTKHQQSIGVLLTFNIFILLAPIWVNAYAYMTLGRMVYYFTPSHSLIGIPAATLAAIFVGLDIVSFIVQLVGGSMAGPSSPPDERMKAIHIYMGGIGLQEFFIVIFVVLCVIFQRKMHKMNQQGGIKAFFTSDWGRLLCTLYFSLAMISVRIFYRLIEFSGGEGQDNGLVTHEIYFYILEAAPMFLALLAFNIVHPGRIMTGSNSEMPGLFSLIKSKFRGGKGNQLLDDESDVEMKTRYEPTREVGYKADPSHYG
ncbi:hypothetical protein ACHAPA_010091 [Fusarium lateritium]